MDDVLCDGRTCVLCYENRLRNEESHQSDTEGLCDQEGALGRLS